MRQAGVATYQRGDYETALREFKLLAQQGTAWAQFNIGRMLGACAELAGGCGNV